MKKYRKSIVLLVLAGAVFSGFAILHKNPEEKMPTYLAQVEKEKKMAQRIRMEVNRETEKLMLVNDVEKKKICVDRIETQRLSPEKIEIRWHGVEENAADQYIVKKRLVFNKEPIGQWENVSIVEGGREEYRLEDILEVSAPVQYEYRVDVEVIDDSIYEAEEGKTALGSNVMVCIDPGHYAGRNRTPSGISYEYAEGDFTLVLSRQLKRILKEKYGIDSYMTRENESITIEGYTDYVLDQGHISLRGKYAALKQSDLFISLHTNANNDHANGYNTWGQPVSINKPIIFVNQAGKKSDMALKTSNAIGINLSKISYELGLSSVGDFREVDKACQIMEWTDAYNDGLNEMGTVVCRMSGDADYYGVLRGASFNDIPGIIIEHGMHTIPEVRKAAQENLAECWAEADAYGIAYGFGFMKEIKMEYKGDKNVL